MERGGPYRAGGRKEYGLGAEDVLRAEINGMTLRLYRNNVLVLATTDATIASGRAGITIYAATIADVELDDFSAGNF